MGVLGASFPTLVVMGERALGACVAGRHTVAELGSFRFPGYSLCPRNVGV